jgi:hypothetical protein
MESGKWKVESVIVRKPPAAREIKVKVVADESRAYCISTAHGGLSQHSLAVDRKSGTTLPG